MSDELKRRFETATDGVTPPPPDLATVRLHGKRRQAAQVLTGALTVTVLISGVLAGASVLRDDRRGVPTILNPPVDGGLTTPERGYRFSFEILDYDPGPNHVELRYTMEWAGENYPGARDCPWTFYREDGSVISTWVHEVGASLQPSISKTTEVTVPEEPVSVAGTCGRRLDRGKFKIVSEPRIERGDFEGEWDLVFRLRLNGAGEQVGTAACSYVIHARGGRVLLRKEMTYTGPGGKVEQRLIGLDGRPTDAEVDCENF